MQKLSLAFWVSVYRCAYVLCRCVCINEYLDVLMITCFLFVFRKGQTHLSHDIVILLYESGDVGGLSFVYRFQRYDLVITINPSITALHVYMLFIYACMCG